MIRGWAVCVIGLAACGGQNGRDPVYTSVDSSGVEVVRSYGPGWSEGQEWRVDSAARVSIGVGDGQPQYELSRLWSATRTSSGNIAVMDGASQELRFFDPAGGYVRSVGGRGSGPGEFVVARFVRPYRGDSLFVHDLVGARITILDSAGSFGRMFSTGKVAGINWWWRGPVAGDRFILESSSGPSGRTRQLTWDSSLVIVAAADGESADTLGMWPYAQSSTAPTPYYAIAHVAPSPAGFFWGMSSEYLIQEYSPAGALLRSIRRAVNPISITQSMLEGYRDDGNEVNTADMQHPDHLPFYSALLVDEVGNLWIRRHGVSRLYAEHREWDVFDGVDGRWLGTVDMPAGLRVTEIGDDYVLGIAADSLGVESVVLHTLRKDGG